MDGLRAAAATADRPGHVVLLSGQDYPARPVAEMEASLAAWSLPAFSQTKPDVLVKQRQAGMTLIAKYFGPLGAMAQGKAIVATRVGTRRDGVWEYDGKTRKQHLQPDEPFDHNAQAQAKYGVARIFKTSASAIQIADAMASPPDVFAVPGRVRGDDEPWRLRRRIPGPMRPTTSDWCRVCSASIIPIRSAWRRMLPPRCDRPRPSRR